MTDLERARRVVAAACVRRYADGSTLELVESLERENAELRAHIDWFRRECSTRTGGYVFGQVASVAIMSIGVLFVLCWFRFTGDGVAFRSGFGEGYRAHPERVTP